MKLQILDAVPEIQLVAVISSAGKLLYRSKVKKHSVTKSVPSAVVSLMKSTKFTDIEIVGKSKWTYLRRIRKDDCLIIVSTSSLTIAKLRSVCDEALTD